MGFLSQSVYFGAFLSIAFYEAGVWMKRKWKKAFLNPLLIAILLTVGALLLFRIPYDTYAEGAKYITYFLTPATVCFAVPLYEQLEPLKKNRTAILLGILAGTLTAMAVILGLSVLFRLSHEEYVTFLPKSVTTAIAMGVSEELGGYVSITAASVILTGVSGNMMASLVCRVFRITDPVARGVGIGTASHAIGTTRAMELGEVEGAMSGLSIVVAGLLTVFAAILFESFY